MTFRSFAIPWAGSSASPQCWRGHWSPGLHKPQGKNEGESHWWWFMTRVSLLPRHDWGLRGQGDFPKDRMLTLPSRFLGGQFWAPANTENSSFTTSYNVPEGGSPVQFHPHHKQKIMIEKLRHFLELMGMSAFLSQILSLSHLNLYALRTDSLLGLLFGENCVHNQQFSRYCSWYIQEPVCDVSDCLQGKYTKCCTIYICGPTHNLFN